MLNISFSSFRCFSLSEMRWMKLNIDVYNRTGKLMEKYNVVDTHLEPGKRISGTGRFWLDKWSVAGIACEIWQA